MYEKITKSMFHDAFRNYDRLDNFSYEAREALYDYLIDLEDMNEQPIELDIISLCCHYSHDKIKNVLKDYRLESLDELGQETSIIWVSEDEKEVLYENF